MKVLSTEYGIQTVEVDSWDGFSNFINEYAEFNHFIWRGQSDSNWLLEPTLDRVYKETGKSGTIAKVITQTHLERFKFATRGRRGINPPNIATENDWWALGQHHGLSTPLLDWTNSPFVAAYFAMISKATSSSGFRVVYGISRSTIENVNIDIQIKSPKSVDPPIIEFINPLTDENTRLVNQRGLFTRTPLGVDMESWYKHNFQQNESFVRMWKIYISEKNRIIALRSLNRMNINHSTLFPDLYGASKFVNLDLEIDRY